MEFWFVQSRLDAIRWVKQSNHQQIRNFQEKKTKFWKLESERIIGFD